VQDVVRARLGEEAVVRHDHLHARAQRCARTAWLCAHHCRLLAHELDLPNGHPCIMVARAGDEAAAVPRHADGPWVGELLS
jgi:hypothetical protein